ncbi:MAG: hypothetical protein MZV63_34365 [Marinilabiliales bacterium]|nr:hypothetical protein [Marinilabiliales bacterium]
MAVGAESRWRAFLHSWCDAGLCGYYFILAVGKNRDTRQGVPGGAGAGRTAGHLTVLFSRKFLAAQKAMPYTDLCGAS